jgi:hypothetical protein
MIKHNVGKPDWRICDDVQCSDNNGRGRCGYFGIKPEILLKRDGSESVFHPA